MAETRRHRRTHKWAFPLGMILIALAVVGVVSLGRAAAIGIQEKRNNPAEKRRYEEFLANIVVHDPDPFDSVQGVPDKNVPQLLDICLWSILQSDNNKPDQFTMDDEGRMQIPKAKVEEAFQTIFGTLPPRHTTVEGVDFDFIYDPAKEIYLVPITAALKIYTPRVTDIQKTGGSITLTVDYLAANDFKVDARGNREEPDASKTMIITLVEKDDGKKDKKSKENKPLQVESIRQVAGVDVVPGTTAIG